MTAKNSGQDRFPQANDVFDFTSLMNRCGGRTDFTIRIVSSFISSLGEFQKMLTDHSSEQLLSTAHLIKGAASQASAIKVVDAATGLENAIILKRSESERIVAREKLEAELEVIGKLAGECLQVLASYDIDRQ